MASRKQPQGLPTHPQLRLIIDAAIKGQSSRQIAKWCEPKVSDVTIAKYVRTVLAPTMRNAEAYTKVLPAKQVPVNESVTEPSQETLLPSHDLQQTSQLAKEAIMAIPVLTVRENRLAALQDRHERLQLIMRERGEEMKSEVAGGASGLLARDYKGKDADRAVYKVDTGLLSEFREHEKQVAIELGQWQEAAAPNVAIQIVMPSGVPTSARSEYPTIDIALPKR